MSSSKMTVTLAGVVMMILSMPGLTQEKTDALQIEAPATSSAKPESKAPTAEAKATEKKDKSRSTKHLPADKKRQIANDM